MGGKLRRGWGLVSLLVFKTSGGQITLSVVGSIPTLSAILTEAFPVGKRRA